MARILIIDDDIEFAENTAMLLKALNHSVDIHHAADDAITVVENHRPQLVILDVMFPGNPAAGFDLACKIRRVASVKHVPIILITGINQEFPMDFSEADADEDWLPIQAFIEKPIDVEVLDSTITRIIGTSHNIRRQE